MRGLKVLFLATAVLTGLEVYDAVSQGEAQAEPAYQWDARVEREPGIERADWMLRVAMLRMARDDVLQAVIDANEVPLVTGEPIRFQLGFETPRAWTRWGSGRSSGRIRQRRELPDSFGQFSVRVVAEGEFHGRSGDVSLLTLRRLKLTIDGGSGGSIPVNSLAMQTGVPIARVWPQYRIALFAVLLPAAAGGDDERAGQHGYWRDLFRSAPTREPLPDRGAIDAAVEALQPRRGRRALASVDFRTYGPLLDAASAAYVLRDYQHGVRIRDVLRADPDLIGEIAEAGLGPASRRDWADYPWIAALAVWLGVQPGEDALRGDFTRVGLRNMAVTGPMDRHFDWQQRFLSTHHAPLLRNLEWTEDPDLLAELEEKIVELSGYGTYVQLTQLSQFVLAHEEFGLTDASRATWQRLRARVIDAQPKPWSWLIAHPSALWPYLLLLPVLALVAMLLPGRPSANAPRIPPGGLLALAAFSFIILGESPLRLWLVPVWWILALLWVRKGPPWWARMLVWLALSLASIDALHLLGWYSTGPVVEALTSSGLMYCWLFLGLLIVPDAAWKRTDLFLVSLIAMCVMAWLDFLGIPLGLPLAVVGIGAFAMFLIERTSLDPPARSPITRG